MPVIVTRPEREARGWVRELTQRGLQAQALPLIEIAPVADQAALVQAWQHLGRYCAVMFVSGNAVNYFFAARPPAVPPFDSAECGGVRAWATGPGTAAALRRAGLAAALIDSPPAQAGQFDSEALWRVVSTQVHADGSVLIVRGGDAGQAATGAAGDGRDWLAQRVVGALAQVDFVRAYERRVPAFSADDAAVAQRAAADGSIWLLSSVQALANLRSWLPGQSWAGARALATHSRIAAAAKSGGFGVVCESRPTLPEVLASIESMQ